MSRLVDVTVEGSQRQESPLASLSDPSPWGQAEPLMPYRYSVEVAYPADLLQ